MLTEDGHVSEGTGGNVFLLRNGVLVTPAVSDDILEGITRRTIMQIAQDELQIDTVERSVDRTELYIATSCSWWARAHRSRRCGRSTGA